MINQMLEKQTQFLMDFVKEAQEDDTPVASLVMTTICQFLNVSREEFVRTALKNDGYVSQKNIIDDQITALRNCIVDLAKLKTLLTEGITKQ